MNFVTKTVVVCVVAVAGWIVMKPPYPEPPTPLDPEEWWGHEDLRSSQNHDIRPFKINFTSEARYKVFKLYRKHNDKLRIIIYVL